MKLSRLHLALPIAAAALGAVTFTSCCRTPENVTTVQPSSSPADPVGVASAPVTIDFPGGTMGDLLGVLPKPPQPPFNLLVAERFRGLRVPAFAVRDADSSLVASALGDMLFPQGVYVKRHDISAGNGAAVYILVKPDRPDPRGSGGFLGWKITAAEAPAAISAMEAAWSLVGGETGAYRVRYHQETETLFLAGSAEALSVAEKVLGNTR